MTKILSKFITLLIVFSSAQAVAQLSTVFGPQNVVMTVNDTQNFSYAFAGSAASSSGKIVIKVGSLKYGDHGETELIYIPDSLRITINGIVFTYNQDTLERLPNFEIPIVVASQNSMAIRLKGDRGSKVLVEVQTSGQVSNQLPSPKFSYTADTALGVLKLQTDGSLSSDPDGQVVSYKWNWGDQSSLQTSSAAVANHTYALPGTYTVQLTVTDNSGGSASISENIVVADTAPPVLNVVSPLPQSTINSQSFSLQGSANEQLGSLSFQFEGTAQSLVLAADQKSFSVNLSASSPGSKSLTLTAVDLAGNSSSQIIGFNVLYNLPVTPSFAMSPTTGTAPELISFSALTSFSPNAAIASYNWDFGDGSVATGALVFHNYTSSGTFAVNLTITDLAGISGTISQAILILQDIPPLAQFSASSATDLGVMLLLVDASSSLPQSSAINTYNWNFGDDSQASGVSASHIYASSGTYVVTLQVSDMKGGISTVSQNVVLADTVAPVLTITNPSNNAILNSQSFNISGSANEELSLATVVFEGSTYSLTLAPDRKSFSANLNATTAGNKNLVITALDRSGNSVSSTLNISLNYVLQPLVLIKLSAGSGIAPLMLALDASQSTDPQGAALSFTWNFGDGSAVASGQQVTHEFNNSGSYIVTLTAVNTLGGSATSTVQVNVTTPALPVAPETIAPPLATNAPTSFDQQVAFLYTGPQAIQTDVVAGALKPELQAVMRGLILDGDGLPLTGVAVTVKDHPEFGKTLTRADGYFDLVANGGGPVVLTFSRNGYLPAQRILDTNANDFAVMPDVALVRLDPKVIAVTANAPTSQFVQGSATSDSRGIRTGALFIPANTSVTAVLPNGTQQSLSNMGIRITEYTVGDNGPSRMPADLPPNSAYTYAMDVTADEALAQGSHDLQFSKPFAYYLDNFLNLPVGTAIPLAGYSFNKSQWIPSTDGIILKILNVDPQGLATLDLDDSGLAASAANLSTLGISDDERRALAQNYPVNKTLWRAQITHSSPWDPNFTGKLAGSPPQSTSPHGPTPPPGQCPANQLAKGCLIELNQRNMIEKIDLKGSDLSLNYSALRQPGRTEDGTVSLAVFGQISNATLVARGLISATVEFSVLGKSVTQTFPAVAGSIASFYWDGKDAFGRDIYGTYPVNIAIGYSFAIPYALSKNFINSQVSFGSSIPLSSNTGPSSGIYVYRTTSRLYVRNVKRSVPANLVNEIGSWTLNMHHHYDPIQKKIYYGSGSVETIDSQPEILSTVVAGITSPLAVLRLADGSLLVSTSSNITKVGTDGVSQVFANVANATAMAVGVDGSVYAVSTASHQVFRIYADGTAVVFAGLGTAGYSGDGGPAISAQLSAPQGIAVDKSGNIFISDSGNHIIRRIKPDGNIELFAGVPGQPGFIDGLALVAKFNSPRGLSFDCAGNLYIVDALNIKLRMLNFMSNMTTSEGPSSALQIGQLANQLNLTSVAALCNGDAYITDTGNGFIYKFIPNYIAGLVSKAGTLTVTGAIANGDGLASQQIKLNHPTGSFLEKDGSILFAESGQNAVRRFGSVIFPAQQNGEISIPNRDGSEIYQFDNSGNHLRTLFGKTGATKYSFTYNTNKQLISVTDSVGNITSLQRDSAGQPIRIQSSFGQNYDLSFDANGYLASLTEPTGETYLATYTNDGLLTRFAPPKGNANTYTYGPGGELATDTNPINQTQTVGLATLTEPFMPTFIGVQLTSPMGRKTGVGQNQTLVNTALPYVYSIYPDGFYDTFTDTGSRSDNNYSHGSISEHIETNVDPRLGGMSSYEIKNSRTNSGMNSGLFSRTRSVASTSMFNFTQTDTLNYNSLASTVAYSSATKTQITTSAVGRQDKVQIDNLERPTLISSGGYTPTALTYNQQGFASQIAQGTRVSQMQYDNNGHLATLTDAIGRVYNYSHDLSGKLLSQTTPDGRVSSFAFDANGNMIRITPGNNFNFDFVLNALDMVSLFQPPSVNQGGALIGTPTQYVYNADKELTQVVRPDGSLITYNYGPTDGRYYGVSSGSEAIALAYYPVNSGANTGIVGAAQGMDGENISYTQDTNYVRTYGGLFSYQLMTQYLVNTGGRVNQRLTFNVNDPNAVSSGFAYDLDGLYTRVGNVVFTRDANGAISAASIRSVNEVFTYDIFGNVASYISKFNTSVLYNMSLTRDNLGRITNKTETILGAATSFDYSYDLAGRLSAVAVNGTPSSSYNYDGNSNRTTVVSGGSTRLYSVDAQDRLISVDNVQYQFDLNGDLKSKLQPGGLLTQYQFSALGQLRSVTLPDGKVVTYKLDGENHRSVRLVNGIATAFYVYDEFGRLYLELDANKIPKWVYHYAPGASSPESISNNHNLTYYRFVKDQLGSIRLVVEPATGTIMQRLDYDEFGNITLDSNPGFQMLGFAGGIYDPDTKLTLFGARSFDSETGRWISKDPSLFNGGMNLYGYNFNDPVNLIDPSGLSGIEFDRNNGSINVYPGNVGTYGPPQSFPAGNNTVNPGGDPMAPESHGPAPNGTFPVGPYTPVNGGPNSPYGSGFFPIDLGSRTGVGVHAGRENRGGPNANTLGCIRTTEPAMDALRRDPPTRIRIGN